MQPAVRRRLWSDLRSSESGQTLIEVLVAAVIFAIVAGALIGLLSTGVNITSLARQRTLAEQAASAQIEQIRNTTGGYAKIGNVAGNPPGVWPLTTPINLAGLSATLTSKITYVNDPTPLSYQSYANYKQVTVTVARSSDGQQLAREVTNIAPPVKASQGLATAPFSVVDIGDNTVVANVQVSLANGPSAPENDTTDASGQITFAGLTPTSVGQPYYDASVTLPSGYVALSDTQSPAAVAHFSLAPGQILPLGTLKIYQPATIYVQLKKFDGSNFTGAATVTVSSTRGTQTLNYSSPQMTWTALNGEPLVPGLNYTVSVTSATFIGATNSQTVPTSYPSNLTSTFVFTAAQAPINTAVPTISGTASVGQTLTASPGTWTGTAPITYTFQWQDCVGAACVDITGATSSTYTVAATDAGSTIQVVVTAANVLGSANASSAKTTVVTGPPVNITAPTISGTAQVGSVLTAANGTWAGSTPINYTYQWQRCSPGCANIGGATSATYTLVAADAGTTIKVVVTATNAYGNANQTSAATATITAPPVNTAVPTVSGTVQTTKTLTATTGTWTGTAPINYTYQWQRCSPGCANIAGATGATYVLVAADAGNTVRVVVTATNSVGSANQASAQTIAVTAAPANTAVPTISGTKTHGFTLTATTGTWTGTPAPTFTYQWRRCAPPGFGTCTNIAGQPAPRTCSPRAIPAPGSW